MDAVLNFRRPDRLPAIEWAPHWDKTVARWHSEGLPAEITTSNDINAYFGLDELVHTWIRPFGAEFPWPRTHGGAVVHDAQEYEDVKRFLYPDPAVDPQVLERVAEAEARGAASWITIEGFFWHPRTLLGIEGHLRGFYDCPELMDRINEDNLEFIIRAVDEVCRYTKPQYTSIAEDMSYNHGPMLSKRLFDATQASFYRRLIPFLREKGIKVFVDSDGLVDEPVDWYAGVGADGFLPLEKQAGVDLVKYRQAHPRFLFLGGYDKLAMNKGEDAMRAEFERLLPVMRQGGYIPGVDHQTPPEVSIDDYRLYLRLLHEYCEKAVE